MMSFLVLPDFEWVTPICGSDWYAQAGGRRLRAKQKAFVTKPAWAPWLAILTTAPKSPMSHWGAFLRLIKAGGGEEEGGWGLLFTLPYAGDRIVFGSHNDEDHNILGASTRNPEAPRFSLRARLLQPLKRSLSRPSPLGSLREALTRFKGRVRYEKRRSKTGPGSEPSRRSSSPATKGESSTWLCGMGNQNPRT